MRSSPYLFYTFFDIKIHAAAFGEQSSLLIATNLRPVREKVLELKKLFFRLLQNFLRFAGGVYGHTFAVFAVVSMTGLNE